MLHIPNSALRTNGFDVCGFLMVIECVSHYCTKEIFFKKFEIICVMLKSANECLLVGKERAFVL